MRQPLEESWPTYSGDYTRQRHSRLTQVNRETVSDLTLNWTIEVDSVVPGFGGGRGFGVLTSAGGVVFTGDGNGNLVAFDAANGELPWHTRIGDITNGPQTYLLDGRQHLLVAVATRLFDFVLY